MKRSIIKTEHPENEISIQTEPNPIKRVRNRHMAISPNTCNSFQVLQGRIQDFWKGVQTKEGGSFATFYLNFLQFSHEFKIIWS